MGGPESRDKDSVTEVAGEAFVRERSPEIERGTVLASRYQIEDIIGKGGSGIVLRVFDRVAQNVVALKVLKSELARDAKWEKRFSRELRLGRPIQHPNVCRIFDIGEADGYRFLTMELASGGSLRDELKRTRSLERKIEDRLADARAVIEGLAALHAAGVVHRDFKPDNILRMGDGRLVLSDFGLATDAANAPGATVLIGTPHYMAPEVLAGEPATSRSDVWALGVVLHEIFFGQRPERKSVSFDGSGRGPLRPTLSRERSILALCERCLAENPVERPADARVVATIFAGGEKVRRRFRGRHPAFMAVTALGVGIVSWMAYRSWQHREVAGRRVAPMAGVLLPRGAAVDWSHTAKIVADVPGPVHCFSMLSENVARVTWGTPRRVEDVDISTGRRHPAALLAETFRDGCPALSTDGRSLLFSAKNEAGAEEIRLSKQPTGADSTIVTSGSSPLWVGDRDEFLYDVDSSHAGIFSLPTMSMALLSNSGVRDQDVIVDKAIDTKGNNIALLVCDETSEYSIVIYSGSPFRFSKRFVVPGKYRVQFGEQERFLNLSIQVAASKSVLATLDSYKADLVERGYYSGFDLMWVHLGGGGVATMLGRRTASDVWQFAEHGMERLTFDGQNFSVARFPSGKILVSKRGDDGKMAIWARERDGVERQVTFGDRDVEPGVAPDGRSWAYADYANRRIVLCAEDQPCRTLREDNLPSWPRFSPDGANLAYLTQVGVQRLTVVSVVNGTVVSSWDAYSQCPPAWSSADKVWNLEVSDGRYSWSEHQVPGGTKTGRRRPARSAGSALGDADCFPDSVGPDSPMFERVRIRTEETSRLLMIPSWRN